MKITRIVYEIVSLNELLQKSIRRYKKKKIRLTNSLQNRLLSHRKYKCIKFEKIKDRFINLTSVFRLRFITLDQYTLFYNKIRTYTFYCWRLTKILNVLALAVDFWLTVSVKINSDNVADFFPTDFTEIT